MEEPDYISEIPDPSMTPPAMALSKKGRDALHTLGRSLGYDFELGRRLYHEVSRNGIEDLQSEGFVPMRIGGTAAARFVKVTLEQLQAQILEAGLLTSVELEDYRSMLESPEYGWFGQMTVSVWGRRILV